jgi:hypothetical protein
MKLYLLIILLLFASTTAVAQENTNSFPQSFIGKWKGSLQWFVAGKPTQTFTMQLHVLPTDSPGIFTWQIMYGDNQQDNRPYLLKPLDTAKAHWVIDENNGILLDNYLFGNCLNGAFTVMGNTIVNSYCLEDGKLNITFNTIKLAAKNTTGKGTEDSPSVETYRVSGYQSGVLIRQKEHP